MVIQTRDGATAFRAALDVHKAEHAFGHAGASLAAVAARLCSSLADHWAAQPESPWVPPFEGATIARQSEFTASDEASAMDFALQQHSNLHVLLAGQEAAPQTRPHSIVRRVRTAVRREPRTQHLAPRFEREIDLGAAAGKLRVDFLGQHYACFFINLTHTERGVDASTERAFSKLFELQAVQRFVQSRPRAIGLLDDERPDRYELLAVGDLSGHAERRALSRIEAVADDREVRVRQLHDVGAAVGHLSGMEMRAA